jgi:hypothetical protein
VLIQVHFVFLRNPLFDGEQFNTPPLLNCNSGLELITRQIQAVTFAAGVTAYW